MNTRLLGKPSLLAVFLLLLLLVLTNSMNKLTAQSKEKDQKEKVNKTPSFVKGELLIQMQPSVSPDILVKEFENVNGIVTQLTVKKQVVRLMNIWLFSFDHTAISHEHLSKVLFHHPQVKIVQNNHHVHYRNTPNDTDFAQQWQYINDGSIGGIAGADIDADLAWDITTGGTTTDGDEIVVCVIDDGIDLAHSDFGDNLWQNTAEIPNNGIDDDGNGFVDDFLGWNAYDDNDVLDGDGSHGTPVAGIVGAQGNNNNGVAGVNWDVKIMVVVGGGAEAQALAAYAYPMEMRKRYNDSNGAEGAFVVATNASWGIDFGQPSDAPLWCAMYDEIGSYGVLNAGATANANVNVEVDGDLPTACPSDYIIAVTNMNWNDEKVTDAGYGATSIDLGAFGEGTYTTALGDTYGGFGGTSGATPHVAGTIGLLYSVNCTDFIALAKSEPGTAALLAKQYIMDGTDANANLQGITVSGGRLNMRGAIDQLVDNCGNESDFCFPPNNLTSSNITDDSFTASWEATDSANSYIIAITNVTDNTLISSDTTTMLTYTFNNLESCTMYEVNISAVCGVDNSSVSRTITVTTTGNNILQFVITVDDFGSETGWSVVNDNNTVVASGGGYPDSQSGAEFTDSFCLLEGCYDFIITDAFGDGICCAEGNGSYELIYNGEVLASGSEFEFEETTNFCIEAACSTSVNRCLKATIIE